MTSEENREENSCGMIEFSPSCHAVVNIEFFNCEQMNYEEERVKSFVSWPVHFPVDPSRLAKAGFYYTGIADEVVCFSCKGHIKNWNYGDIVLKKHGDLYPNCDFIKNRSNNIPLLKTSVQSTSQLENACINSTIFSQPNLIDYKKMRLESERLKTFSGKWPLSFINTSELAHAGFFYTGINCKVQCPYCRGEISNWDINSIPIQEHLKLFPWCDYISEYTAQLKKGPSWFQTSSQDICGNIDKQTFSDPNYAVFGNKCINDNLQYTNLEDLGVHLHNGPIHSHQASLIERLKSFSTWPSSAPVSKEELAAAGFFYIGMSDRTICFYCNGGLCNWEEGDDPWEEHARWYPTCDFLRLKKGTDFIKSCAKKSLVKLKVNLNHPVESGELHAKEPILKKVDDAMKSNLVKYVLETRLFPLHIIRAALLLQIKQTGNVFENIDDLCIAASCLKDEMENQLFDTKPVQQENSKPNEDSASGSVAVIPSLKSNSCDISKISQNSDCEERSLTIAGNSEKSNALQEEDLSEQCICKICMDKEVGVVFLPCGHLPACTICAPALKHCPMCRQAIQATVRVYLS